MSPLEQITAWYLGVATAVGTWYYFDDLFAGTELEHDSRAKKGAEAVFAAVLWLPLLAIVIIEEEL